MKNTNFFIVWVGIYYENFNSAYNNIDHKKIPPFYFLFINHISITENQ